MVKKILIFSIFGGIGDNLIFSPIFRELKKILPNSEIHIAGNKYFNMLNKYNSNISKIYDLKSKKNGKLRKSLVLDFDKILEMRKEKYNLIIDLNGSSSLYMLLIFKILNPNYIMARKSKKLNERLGMEESDIKIYSKRVDSPEEYLEAIDSVHCYNADYEFYYGEVEKNKFNNFLKERKIMDHEKIIVLNTETSHRDRNLTDGEIIEILSKLRREAPKSKIIITQTKNVKTRLEKIIKNLELDNIFLLYNTTIWDVGAVLDGADVIVSPDTGIIHLACCYDKKIVGIYANHEENLSKWKPNTKDYKLITPNRKSIDNNDIRGFSGDELVKSVIEYLKF
jgi:ADP-heptose:LPS heptosyltransferase